MTVQILNKITLFLVSDYITHTKSQDGKVPDVLTRLNSSIAGYKKFHMFTPGEAKIVSQISHQQELKDILDHNISYIIFAMELMKLWVRDVPKKQRPMLISDKHLKLGGKYFFMAMLHLKQDDKTEYERKKDIIDNSIEVANAFWKYHYDKLSGEEFVKVLRK